MKDIHSLFIGSAASFFIAVVVGFLRQKKLNLTIFSLIGAGVITTIGYLSIFGDWSEPIETQKLFAFF